MLSVIVACNVVDHW